MLSVTCFPDFQWAMISVFLIKHTHPNSLQICLNSIVLGSEVGVADYHCSGILLVRRATRDRSGGVAAACDEH